MKTAKQSAKQPRTIAEIPELDWYPCYGAFQLWPDAHAPIVARHSILHPVNLRRIAEEVDACYRLRPLGTDGKRWFYFGDSDLEAAVEASAPAGPKFKVTQALTTEQRIRAPQHEDAPRSPGNRYSGAVVGIPGKRSSTEHAVSAANPRIGMNPRADEARPREQS